MSDERQAAGRPIEFRSVALTGLFLLAVFYTLYFARGLVLPIVLAVLLNFLLSPLVRALRAVKVPEKIGAALVLMALVLTIVAAVVRLSGPTRSWVERAPQSIEQIERRIRSVVRPVEEVREVAEEVETQVERLAGRDSAPREVTIERGSVAGLIVSRTRSFLAAAALMMVLLYFLLASGDVFLRKLVRVLSRYEDKKAAIQIARATESTISRYLGTMTLINIGLGLFVALAMMLLDMPNPWLWGVVAGLLNFVPYLGPLVTTSVIAVVSVLTFDDVGRAAFAPLAYIGLNFLEASFVTPVLLGRRLTLNPVVIFLGVMFWGWLWGIAGALLAVPILVTFKIFCDHIGPLAPVGEFLGP